MHNIRKVKDSFMNGVHSIVGIFNILIVILIFIFILVNSLSFFKDYPLSKFFFGTEWISLSGKYGLLPLLVGSFWVTLVALCISIPIGIITTIYISEFANKKTKKIIKIIIETMSALPSVVLGYLGLYVLSGFIKDSFNLPSGLNALTGGIMLSFMAIPTIVSLSDDALNALDKSYREASLALGANKLETVFKVLLPAEFSQVLC